MSESWELIERLTKDLKAASRLLGRKESRALVDFYYQIQRFRTQSANQVRAADAGEPNSVTSWVFRATATLENDIKRALGEFSSGYRVGQWMQSICGIGPVISAGMLAHIDITKAPTAGHIWRFAGYDPTVKWEKKQKRPWNADLKCLCFKMSDCFVKVSANENDFYGAVYHKRKEYEAAKNERKEYADQAAQALAQKNFGKDTVARQFYEKELLPPGHIHMRAKRYAAKMFLSHLHHVMHIDYYGVEPAVPYSFVHCEGDHRHFVIPPNWPFSGDGKSLKELK